MTHPHLVGFPVPPNGLANDREALDGLYWLMTDHAPDAVLFTGLGGEMRFVSPGFSKMTGWSIEEALACGHLSLIHPDDRPTVSQVTAGLLAGEPGADFRCRYVRSDGSHIWVEARFQVASAEYGLGAGYAGSIRDITDRVLLERQLASARAELAQAAATDGLTRLLSRGRFEDALAAEWARGARDEQPLSLLLLEADCMEAYAALCGPQARDEALRIVAACVRVRLRRATDLAARYGEAAFAVLMPQTDGFGVTMMAEQIRDAVLDRNLPHLHSPHRIVTVSLGTATLNPSQGAPLGALVAKAELALGEARRLGRNRIEADAAVVAAASVAGGWFDPPGRASSD